MGGVYVGPYTATINGVSTAVICDDFYDDSYQWEAWSADIVAGASATSSSTRMDAKYNSATVYDGLSLTQAYDAVGYLATQMLAATDPTTIGEYDFALWSIFDPGAITYGSQPSVYNPLTTPEVNTIDTLFGERSGLCKGIEPRCRYRFIHGLLTGCKQCELFSDSFRSWDYTSAGVPCLHAGAGILAALGVDLSGVAALIFLLRRRLQRHGDRTGNRWAQ